MAFLLLEALDTPRFLPFLPGRQGAVHFQVTVLTCQVRCNTPSSLKFAGTLLSENLAPDKLWFLPMLQPVVQSEVLKSRNLLENERIAKQHPLKRLRLSHMQGPHSLVVAPHNHLHEYVLPDTNLQSPVAVRARRWCESDFVAIVTGKVDTGSLQRRNKLERLDTESPRNQDPGHSLHALNSQSFGLSHLKRGHNQVNQSKAPQSCKAVCNRLTGISAPLNTAW